jgi:DNA-binding HxlR family transcriptional regulator
VLPDYSKFEEQTYCFWYTTRVSPESKPSRRICSITDALSIVGDRYALLVVRELRYGRNRFKDIAAGTGAPRDVLTSRLRKLEQAGLIERRPYSEHPPRYEYLLTESGKDLQPILLALKEWAPSPSSSSTPAAPPSTRSPSAPHAGSPLARASSP